MKRISALIGIALLLWGVSLGGMTAQAQSGGNYFDNVTVGGDLDMYGTGVIRDTRDQTVRAQVTGGGLTVSGAAASANIIAGYTGNSVTGAGSAVLSGGVVTVGSTGSGVNLVSGNYSVVSGGAQNKIYADYSGIGSGVGNRVDNWYSFIGGGSLNRTYQGYGGILSGTGNRSYNGGIVGGGTSNEAAGQYSLIGSGWYNKIHSLGSYGGILGGNCNTLGTTNTCLDGNVDYNRVTINGGSATYGAIINGDRNAVAGYMDWIGNGFYNTIADKDVQTVPGVFTSYDTTYLMLYGNTRPSSTYCQYNPSTQQATCNTAWNVILGGFGNTIANAQVMTFTEIITAYSAITPAVVVACQPGYSLVGNGISNTISAPAQYASVVNGISNTVTAIHGFVGSGVTNTVSGAYGSILSGKLNLASGEYSSASGVRARALHKGAWVWADSTDADYESLAADSFNIRAKGGVRMTTSGAGLTLDGPVIVDGMTFTYTAPITITGVLTNVRLLYYQVP